jgi:hypothetical protein
LASGESATLHAVNFVVAGRGTPKNVFLRKKSVLPLSYFLPENERSNPFTVMRKTYRKSSRIFESWAWF